MSEEMDDLFGDLDRTLESSSEVDEADKVDLSKQAVEEEEFSFLDGEDESFDDDVHVGQSLYVQPKDWPEIKVSGSSVNIVPVLVDDSYSVYGRGSDDQLRKAVRSMIVELRNIKKETGKDTFVVLQGFRTRYFAGNILDLDERELYIKCDVDGTPLVERSIDIYRHASRAEEALKLKGVSTTVNMLVITDGEPLDDSCYPREFRALVDEKPYWKISGLGLDNNDSSGEWDDVDFEAMFNSMGIKKVIIATPSELRRALYNFSRSVSAV
ncbi:hypothetical protein ACFL2R_02390 [Patescibacteria group bacterium]